MPTKTLKKEKEKGAKAKCSADVNGRRACGCLRLRQSWTEAVGGTPERHDLTNTQPTLKITGKGVVAPSSSSLTPRHTEDHSGRRRICGRKQKTFCDSCADGQNASRGRLLLRVARRVGNGKRRRGSHERCAMDDSVSRPAFARTLHHHKKTASFLCTLTK